MVLLRLLLPLSPSYFVHRLSRQCSAVSVIPFLSGPMLVCSYHDLSICGLDTTWLISFIDLDISSIHDSVWLVSVIAGFHSVRPQRELVSLYNLCSLREETDCGEGTRPEPYGSGSFPAHCEKSTLENMRNFSIFLYIGFTEMYGHY